jgi:tape measure domain-containing protein
MSVTVAEGQVVFTADTAELGTGLKKGVADAESKASGAAQKSGSGIGGKLLTGFTLGIGARIGSAVVGATGRVLGTALSAGFTRAITIQNAEAKLTGLGHSAANVTGIMNDALASVKGTAFGLGDAATTAAATVAAGVKPGKDLQQTLKLIGDTATIAGTRYGSMGAIFNSVAAQNKLQGNDIMQLQSQGVPVLQFVAKHMGITMAAASALSTQGKIDFKTFQDSMQEGLGGAALASGNTAVGAFDNMKAALSRFGAVFATPLVAGAPKFFTGLTGVIDSVTARMKPFADRFGPVLISSIGKATSVASDFFSGMTHGVDALGTVQTSAAHWGAAFSGVFFRVRDAVAPFISSFAAAFGPILNNLKPIIPAFMGLAAAVSPLQIVLRALQPILPILGDALGTLGMSLSYSLGQILPIVVPMVTDLSRALSNGLGQAITALLPIVPVIMDLFANLVPVIAQVLTAVLPLATSLVTMLVPILVQLVSSVLPPLISIFQAVAPAILPLVTTILSVLIPVIQALLPVVTIVFSAIVPIITAALQVVQGVIQVVTGLITGNWKQVWAGLGNIVGGAWNLIKSVVSGAIRVVGALISAGLGVVRAIWSASWAGIRANVAAAAGAITSVVHGMVSGVSSAIGAVGHVFAGVKGIITAGVSGANSWLLGIGSQIVSGLKRGISSAWGGVTSLVRGLTDKLPAIVRKALGIASPSKVFAQLGKYVVQGFAQGISKGGSVATNAMTTLTNKIHDAFNAKAINMNTANGAFVLIRNANTALSGLAAQRSKIVDKLKDAQTALTNAQKVASDYKTSTINSIVGGVDPTAQQNAADYVQSLKDQVTQTKTLSVTMAKLKKAGLDSTTYATLAAKGLDALPIAQSILSSGKKGIQSIGTLQGQLGTAASGFATVTADGMYGAGINAAKGLVAGLTSQQAAIDKAMSRVGSLLVTSIKKALGIKSPSTKMRDEVAPHLISGIGVGAMRAMPGLSRTLTNGLSSMVRGVSTALPTVSSRLAMAVTPGTATQPATLGAIAATPSVDNRKMEVTINEAEDPMGTAGRLASEYRKWGGR